MADVNKTIDFTLRAKTAQLEASLRKIPNITDKQARDMVKKLDKGFDKVEKKAKKTARSSSQSFKKMAKGIGAAAIAIGATGAAFFTLNKQIQDSINELSDLSTTSGISVDNLKALKLAARGSGIEFSVLQAGLNKLPSSMQAAARGTGSAAEAFDRLNVDAANADGTLRDANEVFNEVIESLADIESGAERSALAADLFGMKAGAALIQSGAIGSMQQYNDLMTTYGLDTGPAAREEAAEFQRALSLLEAVTLRFGQIFIGTFGENGMISPIMFAAKSMVFFGELMTGIIEDSGAMWDNWFLQMEQRSLQLSIGLAKLEKGFAWLTGGDTEFADTQIANFASQLDGVNAKLQDSALSNLADMLDGEGDAFQRASKRAGEFESSVSELFQTLQAGAAGPPGGGGGGGGGGSPPVAGLEKQLDLEGLKARALQIQSAALSDILSTEDKITQKYQAELEKLDEIATTSQGQVDTELARLEVVGRMERELFEFRLEGLVEWSEEQEQAHQKELDRIETERDARIGAIDKYGKAVTTFASDFGTALQTTLENTGELTAQGAKRLFRLMQAAGVSEVAINTTVAIMKALATLGPVLGPFAAASIGALGAVQTAAILSEQPPSFDMGGMVGRRSGAPDQVQAQLLSGEAVLDRATVRRMGGEEGIGRLRRGGGGDDRIVVISPFKHFDRFVSSSMARNSRLRRLNLRPMRGY